MSKVTDSANGESCTIRIPGVCCFDPSTTVFAHISGVRFGHGTAKKTKLGAYACFKCHELIDGRAPRPENMTLQDVKTAHYEGTFETLLRLSDKGLVVL